jgi:hypothetical protein
MEVKRYEQKMLWSWLQLEGNYILVYRFSYRWRGMGNVKMLWRGGDLAFKGVSFRYTDPVAHTQRAERNFLLGKLIGKSARAL